MKDLVHEYIGLLLYGAATFLSPCSIALISVYLSYAVGVSDTLRKGLMVGCSFAVSMSLVFFFLGYVVSSLIPIGLANYRLLFGIAGFLLIIFGMNNLGLFEKAGLVINAGTSFSENVSMLRLAALTRFSRYNYAVGSFLFAIVISIALGPCSLSLVLPAILLTIFSAPTPLHGGLLLSMFGLGHSLPVVFLGVLVGTARKVASERMASAGQYLTRIFGVAFFTVGIAMIVYVLGGW